MFKGIYGWLFVFAIVCLAVAFPSLALAQSSSFAVDAEPLVDFSGVFY
jgi:hypothetical protein